MAMSETFEIEQDTIVAPATACGTGAVAIVRLSGPAAGRIASQLFQPARGGTWDQPVSHRLYFGHLRNLGGDLLDECMAVLMRAPHSYTGEDVVEFHVHGSRVIVESVMEACMAAGARAARPGEFTQRAFLNGRMDLAQAEAVADLVAAQTRRAQHLALQQLRGGVSARIHALRNELLDVAAELEAWIDFPEEDIPGPTLEKLSQALSEVQRQIAELSRTYRVGQLAQKGARVVLVGEPNAGKSSLFNALIGRERAIVTPHPGTTRDTIESTIDLQGIPVTLVDTAGLRETSDTVERIGVERSLEEVLQGDLVLLVVDSSRATSLDSTLQWLPSGHGSANCLVVLNKSDAATGEQLTTLQAMAEQMQFQALRTSCPLRRGIDTLENAIYERLVGEEDGEELWIVAERHAECLSAAKEALGHGLNDLTEGREPELISTHIREAIDHLGAIIGVGTSEEILDRIFSRFCIGK